MEQTLATSLAALAKTRPCFHSEADFQFALGWQIKTTNPAAGVRLEIPVPIGSKKYKVDLLYSVGDHRVAIELKYFKAPMVTCLNGELFALVDVVAHDLNRYDFLKDIQRLEHVLAAGAADEAYAIVLTNQPKYWNSREAGNRVDEAFGLEHGRSISGQLAWADHVGGTSKGRELAISIAGTYRLDWFEYSNIPDERFGQFRVLAVQTAIGMLPRDTDPQLPVVAPVTELRRATYSEMAKYLKLNRNSEATLTFVEVEAIVGKLPPSARNHRAWWGNHIGNPQARWMDSGWKVSQLDLKLEVVVFRKNNSFFGRA